MSLISYRNQLPSIFDHFFNDEFFDWSNRNFSSTNTTVPSVNIREDKDGFKVELAAPGLDKNDFIINLENNVLTISSDKKEENEVKEGEQFTRREFSYQSFSRSFTLPRIVEAEKIEAKYENGLLLINIPKKEEWKPKPAKQIEIK